MGQVFNSALEPGWELPFFLYLLKCAQMLKCNLAFWGKIHRPSYILLPFYQWLALLPGGRNITRGLTSKAEIPPILGIPVFDEMTLASFETSASSAFSFGLITSNVLFNGSRTVISMPAMANSYRCRKVPYNLWLTFVVFICCSHSFSPWSCQLTVLCITADLTNSRELDFCLKSEVLCSCQWNFHASYNWLIKKYRNLISILMSRWVQVTKPDIFFPWKNAHHKKTTSAPCGFSNSK